MTTRTPQPSITIRTGNLDLARRVAGLATPAALARAMGIHRANVTRTLSGDARLTAEFIAGLRRAFPMLGFDDLFAVAEPEPGDVEAVSA